MTSPSDPGEPGPGGLASPTGLFGGALVFEQGHSFETAPPEVLAILAQGSAASKVAAPPSAELVRFRAAGDRVAIEADLTGLVPIAAAGLSPMEVTAVLARVAAVLSAMHAAGEVHGDLGPWSIRVGKGRVVLLAPPPGVPAGALMVARVRHTGALLSDVAFCSGEVLIGRGGGPAHDVYSFAGLTHWLVSGDLPVGHVDVSVAARGRLRDLAQGVAAGLAATPAQRPPMAALEAALWRTAQLPAPAQPRPEGDSAPAQPHPQGDPAQPRPEGGSAPAQPPPGGFHAPAGAGPSYGAEPPAERKQLSTVLALLLVVGGLFVLVGALWLVAVGWAILGEGGRAGLLFALTAGIAGGGFALEKRGYRSSGFALVVLASQMLWADGGYVLNLAGALARTGPWAVVAAVVTTVSASLAIRRRSLGTGVLAALGFAVFAVCFNAATGRPGQLAFFSGLTLALLLGGLLAVRKGRPELGTGLLAAGAQLLWIDAGCILDLAGRASSTEAWTTAAGAVTAVTLGIAYARRSAVTGLFAGCDFLVFAALFSYVTGRPGQLGLLCAVTAFVAITGVYQARRGREIAGAALVITATQLLWGDAALLLDLIHLLDRTGPWTLASALILSVTYAVTLFRHPSAAPLAALDALVLAACLGAYISRGEPLGPPVYVLCVAWFYAALAAGAQRAKRPAASVTFAGFALFGALGSAFLGVSLLSSAEHLAFGALWPLAPLASLLLFAFRGTAAHVGLARLGTAVLLAVVPVAEAVMRPEAPVHVVIAAVVGSGAVLIALRLPVWQIQIAGAVIALLNAVLVPSAAFLDRCMAGGGLQVLLGPAAPYMLSALGAPIALLLAAAFASPDSPRKAGYRLVEVAALLQLFGLTTLASLVHADDFFYPAVILLTGTFALALGVVRRHVVIVALASVALLLNLWIQYFQKLRDTFPTAVLVIGFGIGLLIAGVIYERKIRHILPKLGKWL